MGAEAEYGNARFSARMAPKSFAIRSVNLPFGQPAPRFRIGIGGNLLSDSILIRSPRWPAAAPWPGAGYQLEKYPRGWVPRWADNCPVAESSQAAYHPAPASSRSRHHRIKKVLICADMMLLNSWPQRRRDYDPATPSPTAPANKVRPPSPLQRDRVVSVHRKGSRLRGKASACNSASPRANVQTRRLWSKENDAPGTSNTPLRLDSRA